MDGSPGDGIPIAPASVAVRALTLRPNPALERTPIDLLSLSRRLLGAAQRCR